MMSGADDAHGAVTTGPATPLARRRPARPPGHVLRWRRGGVPFARSDVHAQRREVIAYLVMEAIEDGKTTPEAVVSHVCSDKFLKATDDAVVDVIKRIAAVFAGDVCEAPQPDVAPHSSLVEPMRDEP